MNPKAKPTGTGTGKMVAERGAMRVTKFFTYWWALLLLGILLIILGIFMLFFNWLEILCCFLANGYTVTGIGLVFIAVGFLLPKTPFPASPLGKVIAAGITGIIGLIMIFIPGVM